MNNKRAGVWRSATEMLYVRKMLCSDDQVVPYLDAFDGERRCAVLDVLQELWPDRDITVALVQQAMAQVVAHDLVLSLQEIQLQIHRQGGWLPEHVAEQCDHFAAAAARALQIGVLGAVVP